MKAPARAVHALAMMATLILGSTAWAAAGEELPQSPRLATLAGALGSANAQSLSQAFWREVEQAGTPLVEPAPGKPARVLMTFLWRAEDARDALNIGVVGIGKSSFESKVDPLRHLGSTDVWYRTYEVESAARIQYYLAWPEGRSPSAEALERYPTDHSVVYETFKDPRSRLKVKYEIGEGWSSYAEGPDAPPEHWLAPKAGIARGESRTFQVASAILGNSRDITVYTPPGYTCAGRGCPFVLIFDRTEYLQTLAVPQLLDNMIADRVIPPMAAVFVNYFDRESARERELTPNPSFARFIVEELLPIVRKGYRLTRDPRQAVIAGASYGGLASAYIARSYPHVFGNVLSQSGSYWWYPNYDLVDEASFPAHWNWLPRQFAAGPKLPLRFYLDVGSWEGPAMLTPNRTFRDLLRAKGYEVSYREFVGAHTYLNWRATFPDGLISLMGTPRGKALLAKEGILHD